MKRCCLEAMFVLLILFARPAAAQQPADGGNSDHEMIRQLLQRVQQLEAEVRELRAQRAAAALAASAPGNSSTAAVSPQIPSAPESPLAATASPRTPASQEGATTASVSPQTSATTDPSAQTAMAMAEAAPHSAPSMVFRGFSDIYYYATDAKGTTNSFALGQFNLFVTSRLSEKMNVLAEAVLEADQNNAFGFELERLLFQYSASDHFNVNVGRYHTAIGWYNTAYHHSTWMQTAVGRPLLFEFEDKGGILPVHNVGISVNGTIPSGNVGLRYVAEVGNGRSSRSLDEPVQNVVDENNGKSFNFALMARPEGLPGFQAGFSIYHDHLTPAGMPTVGETIMAGHAVYQSSKFEWLNEAMVIRDAISGTSRIVHTPALYSQLSRRFGPIRPYFRYQYINAPDRNPLFPDVRLYYGPSVGIRYDISDFAAIKFQYDHTDRRSQSSVNGITTQLSFAF